MVGISRRQIQYWDEIGLVKPSARPAAGRGTRRSYSFDDLVRLAIARVLLERGMAPDGIRRGLACLGDVDAAALDGQKLITDGSGLFLLTKDPAKILEVLDRQAAFSLALGPVVRELCAARTGGTDGVERRAVS